MNKYTKIYLSLLAFTTFTFFIGWFELTSFIVIGILLFTTFLKGYLVIEYFMGLKEVKGKYRYIPTIWLVSIISLIALGYYL